MQRNKKKESINGELDEIILEESYKPSTDEEYMSDKQLLYFRKKLLNWKEDLLGQSELTVKHLQEENWHESDASDRATVETDIALELRNRDRLRKLVNQIDAAIGRIDDGSYGYCEDTGEEIGLKRLMARPIARMCIEAQERHEKFEKGHNDVVSINSTEENIIE